MIVSYTYLDYFTATVIEETIFLVVNTTQIVDGIVGECFQVER